MSILRRALPLALVVLAGCRGPSPQKIVATGLTGALVFAFVTWALLSGFVRLWERVRHGAWQAPTSSAGWPALIGVHLPLSIVGFTMAGVSDGGLVGLTWSCAAAHHLALALIIWRVARTTPAWAAVWAAIPTLGPALLGAAGSRDAAEVAILQWLWGGFIGAAPLVVAIVLLIEARVGRSAHPQVVDD